jgi:prepilin-type N-terminal cleavage/methylation domain-containing protein
MEAKTIKRPGFTAGITLVEIMAAVAILAIAALGTSAFRYHAALGARTADLQTTAARTALLLCESWRGASDPNTFDPTQLATSDLNSALAIGTIDIYEGHAVPADFTPLGIYGITADGVNYYAVLSWKDISPGLRALNVIVAWDPRGSSSDIYELPNKSFKLTTYVAN